MKYSLKLRERYSIFLSIKGISLKSRKYSKKYYDGKLRYDMLDRRKNNTSRREFLEF